MLTVDQARAELLELLKAKSVFHGEFTLASGAKSQFYVDCKLTTLDPKGASLVGQLMHALIRKEEAARNARIDAIGGLTMGADPIALAVAMFSFAAKKAWSVYNSAYDHTEGELAPGMVLMSETIRLAAEEGCEVFDMLRGDEPYKYRFGAVDVPLIELKVDRA